MAFRRPRIAPDPTPAPDPAPRRGFIATLATAAAGLALVGRARQAGASTQGLDPFIGEIMLFAGNFAPKGWAFCDGQLLPIAQNTALFSLLGTMYGGNGVTTFALPDLRGRAPLHLGQGPGLPAFSQGQIGGAEAHTLLATEMPAHSHAAYGSGQNGTATSPANGVPAVDPSGRPAYGPAADAVMSSGHVAIAGGSQPHNNMQPYLVLNYCIALQGVFPSRS